MLIISIRKFSNIVVFIKNTIFAGDFNKIIGYETYIY